MKTINSVLVDQIPAEDVLQGAALENFRAWVAELRTTGKAQGKSRLRSVDDGYCCLGIACALVPGIASDMWRGMWRYGKSQETGTLPAEALQWLGLGTGNPAISTAEQQIQLVLSDGEPVFLRTSAEHPLTCAEVNDQLGWTFKEIADALEYRYRLAEV